MTRFLTVACVLASTLLVAGCEKQMQGMYDQAKYKAYAASDLFDDGGASRPDVPGAEPHAFGEISGTSSGRVGASDAATLDRDLQATSNPYPITLEWLHRGQDRFEIYCAPCHGPTGDGDGMVVRRGFPAPPSYHIDRLRAADDRHFFDVITHGYGIMYPYADRLPPRERWAVIAYIRSLQLSQHAPLSMLSSAERTRIEGSR
jgi:mono/diheme cytochrome c family protein